MKAAYRGFQVIDQGSCTVVVTMQVFNHLTDESHKLPWEDGRITAEDKRSSKRSVPEDHHDSPQVQPERKGNGAEVQ